MRQILPVLALLLVSCAQTASGAAPSETPKPEANPTDVALSAEATAAVKRLEAIRSTANVAALTPRVATATTTAAPTGTLPPTPTATSSATATMAATRQPTTVPVRATNVPATVAPAGGFEILAYRMGYDRWGAPAGMDQNVKTCGPFDNKRPMNRLEAALRVTNNTTAAMKDGEWWVYFYKPDGSEAFSCVWLYERGKPLPDILPGQSADFTFMAWVPRGERVAKIVLKHDDLGASNAIVVPPTLPLP